MRMFVVSDDGAAWPVASIMQSAWLPAQCGRLTVF
jgi:hypothetical protein